MSVMQVMVYIADGWQVPIHRVQFLVYKGTKLIAVLPADFVLDAVRQQLSQAALTRKLLEIDRQLPP